MNAVFLILFLLSCSNIINFGENNVNLTVRLLNTYSMPDETNFNVSGTESIEYDVVNNLWYFVDWGVDGEIGSISGNFPIDSTNSNIQYNVMNSVIGSTGSSGMVYINEYLYIANLITGNLTQINIQTGYISNTIQVYPGLNGLCYVKYICVHNFVYVYWF